MSRPTFLKTFALAILVLVPCQMVAAQQDAPLPQTKAPEGDSWYYGETTPTPETVSVSVQKAQYRAEQRMARMEVMRRYGLSPNRPPAVAVPFTSVHTLSWMRSGKSPFIYDLSQRQTVRYSRPSWIWYR